MTGFNFLLNRWRVLTVLANLFCFSVFWAATAQAASAAKNPGSGNQGFILGMAFDGSYLDYREEGSLGDCLDKDTAYLNGLAVEARYETAVIWTRFAAQYSRSGWADYDGTTQDGTPLTMYTSERTYQYEGDVGYKALNASTSTLTPYIGIGYRIWDRGTDALPDYQEKYTWSYGSAGADYVLRLSRWTAGANAAVRVPFNMRLRSNLAGKFDEATFYLKTRAGFSLELPVTYMFYGYHDYRAGPSFFASFTPYYQYWAIGASDPVKLTKGGVPKDAYYEPDSRADVFGARVGIGLNY